MADDEWTRVRTSPNLTTRRGAHDNGRVGGHGAWTALDYGWGVAAAAVPFRTFFLIGIIAEIQEAEPEQKRYCMP